MDTPVSADTVERAAKNSDALDKTVRVGLVAYGVVHLIVAWLALSLAFGSGQGRASGTGALSQLAKNPVGQVSLYVVAVGFFALVVWQLLEAAFGRREWRGAQRVFRRLAALGRAIVYGALGVSALKLAIGAGSSSGSTDTLTARLMAMPGGPLLVGLVGAVIIAIGGGLVFRGLSEDFTEHLALRGQTGGSGKAVVTLGKVGYAAKGVAFVPVGGLFIWAAWTHDPSKSGGLDQALHKLQGEPYGAVVLVAVAAGIACFGLFCFAWARHLRR
jgi:hypothetical protein